MESFHKAYVWLGGLLGALIASWWHREDLADKKAWIIFVITGASCALYLTGMVSSYFGITDPSNVAGVGFLLGTFGGSLMAAINRAIKTADLWALIRSKFGGG
jgi:paired small multidrug resistance pump